MTKTIAVGDLHLTRGTPSGVLDDFVALIENNRGARLAVAGDLFDLSADFAKTDPLTALQGALASQTRVMAALGEHVDRGGELWLVAGNHDAAVGEPEARAALIDALRLTEAAAHRVRSSPWFVGAGGLHLEHGHYYDPDNAPSHPLHSCVRSLGVHFVEEFIVPTGAFRYLNANDGTPLTLLLSAFRWYGVRGPYVVYRYFRAAFDALARSGPFFDDARDLDRGRQREPWFEGEHGVPSDVQEALRMLGARPTMASFGATFRRLYLDRVGATLMLTAGLSLLATGKRQQAAALLSVGAAVMGVSWALGHDRYGGSVPEALGRAASLVRETNRAELVVFGHAHEEALTDGYANTGSFAFPKGAPGRPYLEISSSGPRPVAERRYVTRRPAA